MNLDQPCLALCKQTRLTQPQGGLNRAARQRVAKPANAGSLKRKGSRLGEWLRRFQGVATRYLGNHLGWRRLIERHDRNISSTDFLRAALGLDGVQYETGILPKCNLRDIFR